MMTTEAVEIPGYIAGTWTIDPIHSHVGFVIKHLMVTNIRGHFRTFEGEIVTAADDPLRSTVAATIDLRSVDTNNEQRDGHIRSADFLEVDTYSAMTFRSTGIRRAGDGYALDGELTLKGVTRPISLELEVHGFGPDPFAPDPATGARAGFTAAGEINRTDFGVGYNGRIPGGDMGVGEQVKIVLEIQAALQPAPADARAR
jgi:polyisoprenoid-binding protein YceI